MIKEKLHWPESIDEFEKCIFNSPQFQKSGTIDTNIERYEDTISKNLETFFSNIPDGEILIKTSVTGNRPKNHEISNEILNNVAKTIIECKKHSKIYLVDGPAYSKSFFAECERLNRDELSRYYNIKIVDLNWDIANRSLVGWPISNKWINATAVINLCKAKTHKRFGVTLGYKNLLGVLPGKDLGFPKLSSKHTHVPILLYKLRMISPPTYTIIDGIKGIEGNGPMNGLQTESHFISFGEGCYYADIRATIEMGFHPALVPGLIRPFSKLLSCSSITTLPSSYRLTNYDFLPPLTCAWLYQSLFTYKSQQKNYSNLKEGLIECWEKVKES